MSQVGRAVKNIETPRPLKSQSSRSQLKNYMLIEELIQLIENVAIALASGVSNPEPMTSLVQNLRIHGPQLEQVSKDTLDRAFVTFRNASQDERLNIMTRLNLLELIELRAKSWQDDGINTYYKHKATNVEPENATTVLDHQSAMMMMSTSPNSMAGQSSISTSSSSTHILGPGELIRTSGKFPKPTKIPGKNYSKDEVVIRNADSGKVMGIKGRRVHMIEELSETIISFQRVNPGAKERLVQITGPNEEKINYAKQLIEDTIRRNASPVRLEPTVINQGGNGGGGSCSSLASSASDEAIPRALNRNSIGAMTNLVAATTIPANYITTGTGSTNKSMRSTASGGNSGGNHQILLHSFSTNDASLGEYKYTVNVGQHLLKITGDCCELVRVAKLVLDDYFSSSEFLASVEAGAAFDGNSTSVPATPLNSQFTIPSSHQLISSSPFVDSGIGLNYMAGKLINNPSVEGDDDVFFVNESIASTQVNGLARSRRSHFSRKDFLPESQNQKPPKENKEIIRYEYERLIYYAKSPHSWALPHNWDEICGKYPAVLRNKVKCENNNGNSISKVTITNNNNNNNNTATTNSRTSNTAMLSPQLSNNCSTSNNKIVTTTNIVRKGFFNRATLSIDEGSNENNSSSILYNNNNSNDKDFNDTNNDTNNRPPKLTVDFRSNSTCD